MTYVITNACVGVKAIACLDACPVDAIHPLRKEADFEVAERLFIDPSTCISCGLCEQACPVGAAISEYDATPEDIAENENHFR